MGLSLARIVLFLGLIVLALCTEAEKLESDGTDEGRAAAEADVRKVSHNNLSNEIGGLMFAPHQHRCANCK
jgi:hypothetical protein